MAMLADTVDGVIGVDTHRDTLAAAAVTQVGGVLAQTTTSADAAGYQHLLGLLARPCLVVEFGRWKPRAASAPAWPCSCSSAGNTSSRSVDPSGQHPAPAPRATRWTPSEPPGKPSARSSWPPTPAWPAGGPAGAADHPTLRHLPGWPPSASSKP
jgi:hypothetical protein